MKHFIIGLLLLALSSSFAPTPVQQKVFVCNGKYSKKYHLVKNCRGLKNCSTAIEEVSLSNARDKGRTLCGWED
jgi:hypothetical protein